MDYYLERGFSVKEVNLLDFTNLDDLESELRRYDVLWFNGGNTYYLRWALKESKSEDLIKKLVSDGVVFAGDSAGAVIAGPTIEHYESADDPSVAPEYVTTGLALYDKAIIPHWGSEAFSELLIDIESKLKDAGFKTQRLTDDEYIMYED